MGWGRGVSRGRQKRTQQEQCITFRECFGEKVHTEEGHRDISMSAEGRDLSNEKNKKEGRCEQDRMKKQGVVNEGVI